MIDELELYAQIDALQGRVVELEEVAQIQRQVLSLMGEQLESHRKMFMDLLKRGAE